MTEAELTIPQARALDWLPADGAMVALPGMISAAVNSLYFHHRELVSLGTVRGPRGGIKRAAGLTKEGQKKRADRSK